MNVSGFFTIKREPCADINEFVDFWRRLYNYSDDNRYNEHINSIEFTKASIEELFQWKNGMTLKGSGGKEKSLNDKIINRISIINQYKKQKSIDLKLFNADFANVSAVWRIFLLHTIKPTVYPIYDQHIHRCFNFINNLDWRSINNTIADKTKLDFYFNTYLPYINSLGVSDLKAMDEAFFAFGQFLNTRNQNVIL